MTAAIAIAGFSACNNDAGKQDVTALKTYVDSVDAATPVYSTESWTAIDNEYQARVMKTDADMAKLNDEQKAEAEAAKAKYAALKAKYEAKIQEEQAAKQTQAAASDYRMVLRNALFGEGKIGKDIQFNWVTADNIKDVYQNFVDKVADNKDKYTREDWDEIKVLYEALDTRKNEVEKDMPKGDNMKIAGLKIRFVSILDTHRPMSKVEENEKSKK